MEHEEKQERESLAEIALQIAQQRDHWLQHATKNELVTEVRRLDVEMSRREAELWPLRRDAWQWSREQGHLLAIVGVRTPLSSDPDVALRAAIEAAEYATGRLCHDRCVEIQLAKDDPSIAVALTLARRRVSRKLVAPWFTVAAREHYTRNLIAVTQHVTVGGPPLHDSDMWSSAIDDFSVDARECHRR